MSSTKQQQSFKEENCSVCLEEFPENFTPLQECGHYIHIKCIVNSGKDECPLCRTKVTLNAKDMESLQQICQRHIEEREREYENYLRSQERQRENSGENSESMVVRLSENVSFRTQLSPSTQNLFRRLFPSLTQDGSFSSNNITA